MSGGSDALTVTEKTQLAWLTALSTAVHVTFVTPVLKVVPLGGVHPSDLIPDRSVAVGAYDTIAVVVGDMGLYELLSGHYMVGALMSDTVTENEHVDVLPALSVTEHTTVVNPRINHDPLPGVHFERLVLIPELSEPEKVQVARVEALT